MSLPVVLLAFGLAQAATPAAPAPQDVRIEAAAKAQAPAEAAITRTRAALPNYTFIPGPQGAELKETLFTSLEEGEAALAQAREAEAAGDVDAAEMALMEATMALVNAAAAAAETKTLAVEKGAVVDPRVAVDIDAAIEAVAQAEAKLSGE